MGADPAGRAVGLVSIAHAMPVKWLDGSAVDPHHVWQLACAPGRRG